MMRILIPKGKLKYGSHKVQYMGETFDSTRERDRYIVLKSMEKKGEIEGLELHKCFTLLPKITREETIQLKTKTKVVERVEEKATLYHCDFYYFDKKKNQWVIEEIKSAMTKAIRDYPLRRKLVKLMIIDKNKEAGYEKYVFNELVK